MEHSSKIRHYPFVYILVILMVYTGCNSIPQKKIEKEPMKSARDINTVKEAHTPELMEIPGVVGVYVGATDDGAPFIGVMVVKKTPELERKIPPKLEGYPVLVEETGEIKPLK
ncbi:MAG: hypothetical protein ABSB78_01130 [Bacteroidota bacterium]